MVCVSPVPLISSGAIAFFWDVGVLGLRFLGSCDITLMTQRCVHDDAREDAEAFDEALPGAVDMLSFGGEFSSAAAALNYGVVPVERNSVLGDGWEVGHHTASSLTSGIGDQASGRVDVPGGVSKLAAATQGPSMRFAPLNSKTTVLGTGCQHDVSHVTLLVRSLSGETLVVVSDLDELVSHFCTRHSKLTGVLQCHFSSRTGLGG